MSLLEVKRTIGQYRKVDNFTQFGRLPRELRNLIWKFACCSGPMQLSLKKREKYDMGSGRDRHYYELQYTWLEHIAKHQRQRMAILHVNTEAHSDALRYIEMVTPNDFPFIKGVEDMMARLGLPYTGPEERYWEHSCLLAINWHIDLVHFERPLVDVGQHAAFCDKITRLAVNLDPFECQLSSTKWSMDILERFPALEHLTLLFNGSWDNMLDVY